MIANPEMVALCLNIGIDHLIIEELRRLGIAGDSPVIKVQQSAEELQLPPLIEDLHRDKVRELAHEGPHSLVKQSTISLDLRTEQHLHALIRELRVKLGKAARRIRDEPRHSGTDAGLRSHTFEQNAVKDLDRVQLIALRLKESSPLLDGGCYDRIVIVCEGNLGAIALEEVLIHMESGAECLQRRFEALDRVFLLTGIERLVIDAADTKDHSRRLRSWSETWSHPRNRTD